MAHEKTQATQLVRDYAMVPSAVLNLSDSVCLLKFVTKAPKFGWPNHLIGGGLVTTEDCGLGSHIHLDSEWIEAIFGQSGFDKRQKLTNIVSIGHDVD